ncbi:MAG TPA: MarR family transcriptional regulator [Gaiellaceae bacterium]|nr:MarR family transcriptional regulator [Gaiellaceae bacterium]
MTDPESIRLAEQLERLILLLARSGSALREADERPLSWTQRLALAAAVDDSPLRLGALAERMATTDATASRTVDSLEAMGLLRREPDPSDRRGVLVVATAEAVKLLAERRARLVEALARGLAAMPEKDQARLVFLLDELNEVLEAPAPAVRAAAGA